MNFIKNFFSNSKKGLLVLFYALKDKRTPLFSKIMSLFAIVYLISPIDLLPDTFFPLGFADDLAIVPALFYFIYKNLPPDVLARAREDSLRTVKQVNKGIIILLISAAAAFMLFLIVLYFLYQLIFK